MYNIYSYTYINIQEKCEETDTNASMANYINEVNSGTAVVIEEEDKQKL